MRELINEEKMRRTIRRLTHEIIEQNNDLHQIILLGIKTNGVPLSKIIKENILSFEGVDVPTYELDISGYRDDKVVEVFERLDVDVNGKIVIIVDDVLFTGRTVRAAMDAIIDLGRPNKIQLAVLVDRGHREIPIRSDFVGKNIPTSLTEKIVIDFTEKPGIYIFENTRREK